LGHHLRKESCHGFSASVRDRAVAEINITPLVDVMLVLLIIFMVSAPMISRPLTVNIPQHTQVDQPLKVPSLMLEIADDGAYRLDGRLLSQQQLGERLQDAVVVDPRTVLTVHATSNADYQRVVTAMVEARDSGIETIGIRP
jgi:biopolymer transport protein ExbD